MYMSYITLTVQAALLCGPEGSQYYLIIHFPIFLFVISAVDRIAPVLVCPEGFSELTSLGLSGLTVTWISATATDNSGEVIAVTSDRSSPSFLPIGETLITYSASDASGNVAMCSFTITVIAGNLDDYLKIWDGILRIIPCRYECITGTSIFKQEFTGIFFKNRAITIIIVCINLPGKNLEI